MKSIDDLWKDPVINRALNDYTADLAIARKVYDVTVGLTGNEATERAAWEVYADACDAARAILKRTVKEMK